MAIQYKGSILVKEHCNRLHSNAEIFCKQMHHEIEALKDANQDLRESAQEDEVEENKQKIKVVYAKLYFNCLYKIKIFAQAVFIKKERIFFRPDDTLGR